MRRQYCGRRTRTGLVLAAAVAPLGIAGRSIAATKDWNVSSGNWSVGTNWSPSGVPQPNDVVRIIDNDATSRTITLNINSTGLASLTIDNTGAGTNTLSFGGAFQLSTTGNQTVGSAGHGAITQSTGTNTVGGLLSLGDAAAGVGTYSLSGGALSIVGDLDVGGAGTGFFNQSGGALTASAFMVGDGTGSGTAIVSAGTLATDTLIVGNSGHATFTASGGTVTVNTDLTVGKLAGGIGLLNVSNTAQLNVSGTEFIGVGASGTLNQSGGSHTASSLSVGSGSNASGTVTLSGGTFSIGNNSVIGVAAPGTFTQSGGTHTTGGSLILGLGAGGTYTLSGGTLDDNEADVGKDTLGTFNHSGGTHTVSTSLFVGLNSGGNGTYAMSNTANLNVLLNESIGFNGIGRLNQTGGTNHVTGNLIVGNGSNSFGTINLSGAASRIAVDGTFTVGLNGVGAVTQASGSVTAGTGLIISPTSPFFNDSNYSITGGTLTAPQIDIGKGGRLFMSGSTVSATNINIFPEGSLGMTGGTISNATIMQSGTMTVTAGSNANVPRLVPAPGSLTQIDGNLTINGGLTNDLGALITGTGRITFSGTSTSSGWGTIIPAVTLSAATASLTAKGGTLLMAGTALSNAGTLATLPGTSLISYATSVTNSGSLTVAPGSTMSFAAPIAINSGKSLSLSGGTFASAGLTANSGAMVSGFGIVSTSLTNSGAVSVIGPSQLLGNVVNNASGTVTVRNSQLLITGATTNNGAIHLQTGGSVVFDGGLTGNPVGASAVPAGAATLEPSAAAVAPFVRQNSLTLGGTAGNPATYSTATIRKRSEGGDTSVLGALTFQTDGAGTPLGKLDLADTALIVNYTGASPLPSLRSAIASAFSATAAAHWTGPGLTSSAAAANPSTGLGYGEAGEVLALSGTQTANFQGQPADADSVLVRYTILGDANLSGNVDFIDLVALAQNYNADFVANPTTDSWWTHGDFNYDGKVDFNDLVKLAQNYNQSLPADPVPSAFASVPEPTTITFGFLAYGFMRRRRHRRGLPTTLPRAKYPHPWTQSCSKSRSTS